MWFVCKSFQIVANFQKFFQYICFQKSTYGWAQWLTLVIQHFGRLRQVDYLRSGVQDKSGQHGNSISTKNYKN